MHSRYSPHVRPAPETAARAAWLAALDMLIVNLKPGLAVNSDWARAVWEQGYSVERAAMAYVRGCREVEAWGV